MTPEQFCCWLQGLCELNVPRERPTERQRASIREHLQLTFKKVTAPIYGPKTAAPAQHIDVVC